MYRPGVDVIVVNYRTPEDLKDFLTSLAEHEPTIPWSLTVVDVEPIINHEPDLSAFFDSGCSYIHIAQNVGYARAVNHAAMRTDREHLAIFNADVVLTADSVDDCVLALASNDDWGVLGPLQTNGKGRITHGGILGTNRKPYHRGWRRPVEDQYRDVHEAVSVSGSAYFIKRAVWDELHLCLYYKNKYPEAEGAFLPTPHYYEETWCSYHARDHGYKVMYYGPVEIVHKWHQASPVGGYAEQQMPKSREIFRDMCSYHNIECE